MLVCATFWHHQTYPNQGYELAHNHQGYSPSCLEIVKMPDCIARGLCKNVNYLETQPILRQLFCFNNRGPPIDRDGPVT